MGGSRTASGRRCYEAFAYSGDGLLMAQNLMDYLLPSRTRCRRSRSSHHETPSPHTVFGQKGSGE